MLIHWMLFINQARLPHTPEMSPHTPPMMVYTPERLRCGDPEPGFRQIEQKDKFSSKHYGKIN